MNTEPTALLRVRELCVNHTSARGELAALRNVSFDLQAHECLGLVGESGSGKTQLLHALLGLCGSSARVSGSARFHDQELIGAPAPLLAAVRGRRLGLVFQDPMSALNPYLRIGTQLCEGARAQLGLSRRAAWQRATALLDTVQIDEPELRLRQYPQELSGGMRQRVMIAMALMCEPEVLLLDEPTTALDVTVQAQVLSVLRELRSRTGVAMIFVTHDLGVLAAIADRVAVMYAGRIVELASVTQLYAAPQHPYTTALLRALPRLDTPLGGRLPTIPGQSPSAGSIEAGCSFAPRCAQAHERCRMVPTLRRIADRPDHAVACHLGGL